MEKYGRPCLLPLVISCHETPLQPEFSCPQPQCSVLRSCLPVSPLVTIPCHEGNNRCVPAGTYITCTDDDYIAASVFLFWCPLDPTTQSQPGGAGRGRKICFSSEPAVSTVFFLRPHCAKGGGGPGRLSLPRVTTTSIISVKRARDFSSNGSLADRFLPAAVYPMNGRGVTARVD